MEVGLSKDAIDAGLFEEAGGGLAVRGVDGRLTPRMMPGVTPGMRPGITPGMTPRIPPGRTPGWVPKWL